jgi:hypothetical protein
LRELLRLSDCVTPTAHDEGASAKGDVSAVDAQEDRESNPSPLPSVRAYPPATSPPAVRAVPAAACFLSDGRHLSNIAWHVSEQIRMRPFEGNLHVQDHANAFPGREKGADEREREDSRESRDARRSRPSTTWAHKAFIRPSAIKVGCQDRKQKQSGASAAVVTMNGMRMMSPAAAGMSLVQPHADTSVLLAHFDAPLAVESSHSSGKVAPAAPRAGWCTQRSDRARWEEEAGSWDVRKDGVVPPLCNASPRDSQGEGENNSESFGLVRSIPGPSNREQVRPSTATIGGDSAALGAGEWRPRNGNNHPFTRLLPSATASVDGGGRLADRERLRFGAPMQATSRADGGASWPSSTLEAVSSDILISGSALGEFAIHGNSPPSCRWMPCVCAVMR